VWLPREESRSAVLVREWSFYVYIMSSLSWTLYSGVANDFERRVAQHKEWSRMRAA
jgi:predicted GIY-YIG superfamily endonuclease